MFSVRQKREIADKIQQVLRNTGHPELPEHEINFKLNVYGATSMSHADIFNNGAVPDPSVNPHNEQQDPHSDELANKRLTSSAYGQGMEQTFERYDDREVSGNHP